MSAIFGIINFSSALDPAKLIKMQEPMLYWGPDGRYLWNEGPAGFGHLQLYNTPESKNEKFPLTDNDRGLIFFSAGRIDNRSELFNLLDIPNERKNTITDAELMFNAYRKWDKNCVDHLLGDWTFLIYNKLQNKLFIARDHHGISGLYYYLCKDFFAFSSSLKGILALPEVPKEINELRVAQILVSWPGDGKDTCYKGVQRLPPAHYLTVQDKELKLTRYWYLEKKDLGFKTNEEYIEAFREIFTEAVRCRLRSVGKVGSTLSSGLDSSSVSVIAANLLKEQGIRLPVFTSAPKYDCSHLFPNRITDESILAAKTVEYNGNMDHFIFRSENSSVLEAIKKSLWIHDQPIFAPRNSYWINSLMEITSSLKCSSMLIGQYGNGTISWPSTYKETIELNNLIDWLKLNKIKLKSRFIESIIDYKKNKSSRYGMLSKKYYNILRNSKSAILSEKGRLGIIKPGKSLIGQIWFELGAAFSIEIRDPTIDKNVMEFCISVPDIIYNKEKNNEILIKQVISGLVPNSIIWNRNRGIQSADVVQRILNEIEKWEKMICLFKKCSYNHELLNLQKLEYITKTKVIKKKSLNEISFISRSFMIGLWLNKNCNT